MPGKPAVDRADEKPVPQRQRFDQYVKFNKPFEVLCQFSPSPGRLTLKDFIPVPDIYPAGRLDYRSEGLLMLTNHTQTIHRLTSPHFDHPKTYLVQVEGLITEDARNKLIMGNLLPGELTRPVVAELIPEPALPPRPTPVRGYHPTSWLRLTLREGKKHQIRRMTAAVGFPTLRLVRVSIGSLTLDGLAPGEWQFLSSSEITRIHGELRLAASGK